MHYYGDFQDRTLYFNSGQIYNVLSEFHTICTTGAEEPRKTAANFEVKSQSQSQRRRFTCAQKLTYS